MSGQGGTGWAMAWRLARRELRGGVRGLPGLAVLVTCLALGVATIAGVGMIRSAIGAGMTSQGAQVLGGDAQIEMTYRMATPAERDWMAAEATAVSEVAEFRSMAVFGEGEAQVQALVQAKAVDAAYPLLGQAQITGAATLDEALAEKDGLYGVAAEQVLVDQLGLSLGDPFRLGGNPVRLGAILMREPDGATGGFAFAPRVLLRLKALEGSNLLAPGTLYDAAYRMTLPDGADLDALRARMEAAFPDGALRWTDKRRPAPGVETFVERLGSFLVLVGLAGLAVGGVGVASAVRVYLDGKIATIATLRTLGAPGRLVFRSYLLQIAVLSVIGVLAGLALGIGLPLALRGWIEAMLPFPADIGFAPRPAVEAALYGLLAALIFALAPLSRTEAVTASSLYRGEGRRGLPRPGRIAAILGLTALLVGLAAIGSGMWELTLWTAAGVVAALVTLAGAALVIVRLARRMGRSRRIRGRPGLRLALAAIGAPGSDAMQVVLALGLGLTTLATVGQIDANLRAAISTDLTARAPSFFFVDIQPDQIDPFRKAMEAVPTVSRIESAPMLRAMLTRINGEDARKVAGDHWVVQGDRGISYADALPPGTKLTAGQWWPPGHDGTPEISFAEEEALEMGLKIGDMLTVNVLGREIEARLTSLRDVDFSNAGMGFVMILSPGPLQGAPHSHLATVYAEKEEEAAILRLVTREFPNVTAVSVRTAAERVTEVLGAIAQATTIAASVTLLTGFAVLIGVAAAGERARRYEAAILKVLGMGRAAILGSFALRAGLLGGVAGLVAVAAGSLGAFAVIELVMTADFRFFPIPALWTVLGGILLTLVAGLILARRSLGESAASVLRNRE